MPKLAYGSTFWLGPRVAGSRIAPSRVVLAKYNMRATQRGEEREKEA